MERTATAGSRNPSRQFTRMLCEGAMMVVLAQLLGFIRLWVMPWGGTVSLYMLPIFVFAIRWGVADGMVAGCVLGIVQFLFEGGFVLGWQSILGDYLIACAVLGLAGLFRGKKGGIFLGTVVGSMASFLIHYVVGATVWASYMPPEFFGMTMTTPWFYSLLYNGSYMSVNMTLCMVLFCVMYAPLKRYLTGADLQR